MYVPVKFQNSYEKKKKINLKILGFLSAQVSLLGFSVAINEPCSHKFSSIECEKF